MLELLLNYTAFLLKVATVVIAIVIVLSLLMKNKTLNKEGTLTVEDLRKKYKQTTENLQLARMSDKQKKEFKKQQDKQRKWQAKQATDPAKPCVFVVKFTGDVMASAVNSLRQEITAILAVADPTKDEVLLCLESPGGVVHGYGLAASQLKRLRDKGLKLTAAVDKVAASGGYMMACVADKIVAAPFAIIGSIGVVAQVPNVHKLLKKHDVDFDIMTAGQYKRTVTIFGENTEQGKQKFQQELEQTHNLFQQFVSQNRSQVDLQQIATGEHWFGTQALELKLVDELGTSDDLINAQLADKDVLAVSFGAKAKLLDKLLKKLELSVQNVLTKVTNGGKSWF